MDEVSHYFKNSIFVKRKQRDPMWRVIENPWDRDESEFTALYGEMINKYDNVWIHI